MQNLIPKKMSRILDDKVWDDLRDTVELHLQADSNITDVIVKYQVKIPKRGTRNYITLNTKLENNEGLNRL